MNILQGIIYNAIFQGAKGDKGDKGDPGVGGWTKVKKITVVNQILVGTTIDCNTAGLDYTITGDNVALGINAPTFNANVGIYITFNGVDQEKGDEVIYVNATSIKMAFTIDPGEEITINQ